MDKGKRVKESPQIEEIREYKIKALSNFWDEHKRLINPQEYYVDLSQELWELKDKMIKERRKN
jgi:nicotinate phosphoribosyltransferase